MIFNLTNPNTNIEIPSNLILNSESSIIKEYNLNNNLRNLFNITEFIKPYINDTSTPESPYAEFYKLEKPCNVIQGLDETTLTVLICIPLAYFLTIFILCCIYYRYRKVRKDYERLSHREAQGDEEKNNDNNDQQLEINF